MKQSLVECKQLIITCMLDNKQTRNCDKTLCFNVWNLQGIQFNTPSLNNHYSHPENFHRMYSPETIIRMRRHIQNTEGQYLPTDPLVMIRRNLREQIIREYYKDQPDIIDLYTQQKYQVK